MAFEPTTPENKHQLTKKAAFHMRAILKRFTNSANRVEVTEKPWSTATNGITVLRPQGDARPRWAAHCNHCRMSHLRIYRDL